MQKGEKYKGVDIGAWKYDGPKDFVKKLMDKFGPPTAPTFLYFLNVLST